MKSFKFIFLILLLITQTTLCFAGARLTDVEKTGLTSGIVNSLKSEQNPTEDLSVAKVRSSLNSKLNYLNQRAKKINLSELNKFIDDFDKNFAGKTSTTQDDLNAYLTLKVEELNNAPFVKANAQEACNLVFCKESLQCAIKLDDTRKPSAKCEKNSDCQTGVCSREKICEKQKICYMPAGLGQSCAQAPCDNSAGAMCMQINADSNGIGQCIRDNQHKSCKSNVECCSNKCEGGKCIANKVCKKACSTTKISKEIPSCCEGYFKMQDGKCDSGFYIAPPALNLPAEQTHSLNTNHTNNFLISIINFFLSPVEAAIGITDTATTTEYTAATTALNDAKDAAKAARLAYCTGGTCDTACATDVGSAACTAACGQATGGQCGAVNTAQAAFNTISTSTNPIPCRPDPDGMGQICTPEYNNAQQALTSAQNALPGSASAVSSAYTTQSQKQEEFNAIKQNKVANENVKSIKDSTVKYSELARKSDLNNCSIDLVSDYRILLQKARQDGIKNQPYDSAKSNMFDLQMAMAAFDYVAGGTAPDDYFLDTTTGKSVNKRLNEIAKAHASKRDAALAKLKTNSDRLTCQCYKIKIEVYKRKLEAEQKTTYVHFAEVSADTEKKLNIVCGPEQDPGDTSPEDKADYLAGVADKATLHTYLKNLIEKTPTAAMDDSDGTKAAHFLTTLSGKLAKVTTDMGTDYGKTQQDLQTLRDDFQTAITSNVFKNADDENFELYRFSYDVDDGWIAAIHSFEASVGNWIFNTFLGLVDDSSFCLYSQDYCHYDGPPPPGTMSPPYAQLNLVHTAWKGSTPSTGAPTTTGCSGSGTITEPCYETRPDGSVGHGNRFNHWTTYYFKKVLHMPKNTICATSDGKHFSSAACIKHFVEYNQYIPAGTGTNASPAENNTLFILDPFIPVSYDDSKSFNIPASENGGKVPPVYFGTKIIDSDIFYPGEKVTELFEAGFVRGKQFLTNNRRGDHDTGTGLTATEKKEFLPAFGGNVANSSSFYNANYRKLRDCNDGKDVCTENVSIRKIKENAKRYALDSGLFQPSDAGVGDNLKKFADYAFQLHFVLPKQSRYGSISHEPEVAKVYFETMANGVAAAASATLISASGALIAQNVAYANYEAQLIATYPAAPGSAEALAQSERLAQIAALNKAYKAYLSNVAGSQKSDGASGMLTFGGMGSLSSGSTSGGSPTVAFNDTQTMVNTIMAQQQAVGKYNTLRNAQLSKIAAVQKSAASTPDGTSALNQIKKAGANFTSAMTSPLSGKGSSYIGASNSSNVVNNHTPAKESDSSKYNKPNFYAPIDSGSSRHGGGGSTESAPVMDPNSETAKNAKILQDAIDARNKAGKDKYSNGDEGQTIFDIITNTYIRNYDKVLIKKDATK